MAKSNLLSFDKWFAKLKKIKHIEVYAVVILVVFVLAILFWPTNKQSNAVKKENVNTITSSLEYAKALETKLENVLSLINGAGDVSCMITLDGEIELVLAYSNDERNSSTQNTTSSGTVSKTESNNLNKEPILITVNGSSQPLVLSEILPNVKGVVVVASGAKDVRVKLDILKAVQALLNVESSQIEIFSK